MPRHYDIASAQYTSPNTDGASIAGSRLYVVIHTADGTYSGTISWQMNPDANVSSHFIVAKDGRCAQMLDTNTKSWCQKAGNPYSIAIENEGNENTPLTAQQIEKCAQILARLHQETTGGIPLRVTGQVGVPGLGHHSMGAESGVDWGHSACPGSIIKGQKQQIVDRATQIVNGITPPPVAPTINMEELVSIVTCTDGSGTEKSANNLSVPTSGRGLLTPNGFYSFSGSEVGGFDSTFWKNTPQMKWADIKFACDLLKQPTTLSDTQLGDVKTAANEGAATGARAGINGATAVISAGDATPTT
jgi:hypothetical protein